MSIPLSIAEKLLKLAEGGQLPSSQLKHAIAEELINEGIMAARIAGRTKSTLYITNVASFNNWLFNKYAIHDLAEYIRVIKDEDAGRAALVQVGNNSKIGSRRTFKGFLVNSYMPIACRLNDLPYIVHPASGSFQFVYDFEHFTLPHDVVIAGIENAENFRHIEKQQYLFTDITPLFVCRYPQEQSKDLMKWLLTIPNQYLHFGDFDFAGINIYQQEYKKHLRDRASFFIPPGIEQLLEKHGNKALYDQQQLNATVVVEANIQSLITLLHKYKAGLEQEALLM